MAETATAEHHTSQDRAAEIVPADSLFGRLKDAAAQDWQAYADHEFIQKMEAGTLEESAFRQYLIQDYLFLVQFARAYALAGYKSRALAEIRAAQAGLENILSETELHVRLCARWGLSREDLEGADEHPTTVAYTRYVLDAGSSGDLLDLFVALSPCQVGYALIGERLAPALQADPDHPYAEWIAEYSSEGFRAAARDGVDHIDRLARRCLAEGRLDEITEIFAAATRLEAQFWQMGLDLGAAETSNEHQE